MFIVMLRFSFLCVLAVGLIDPKDSLKEKLEAAESEQKDPDAKPERNISLSFDDLAIMEDGASDKSPCKIGAESTTDDFDRSSPGVSKENSGNPDSDNDFSFGGLAE